jgi:alkylated DNA repair dioxygenase AlkB
LLQVGSNYYADGAQLKRHDDGERSDNNIDAGSDYNDVDALQRPDFGEPLLKDVDGSKLAEMMYKLKGFLKQAEEEQYTVMMMRMEEDDESSELQPTNVIMTIIQKMLWRMQSSYYAQKYDKQVIYIKSYRRRERWLDAAYCKGSAYFSAIPEENIVDKLGVKCMAC